MHTEWPRQNAAIFDAFRRSYPAPSSGLLRRHAAFQAAGARCVRGLQFHIKTLSFWLAARRLAPVEFLGTDQAVMEPDLHFAEAKLPHRSR
jgi:hypothetical protein